MAKNQSCPAIVVGSLRTGRKPDSHRKNQKLNARKTSKLVYFIRSDEKKRSDVAM